MSLLMQALKKAERKQQDALPGDEAAPASQALDTVFDQVLALTPDDIIAGRVPPAPAAPASPVFSLEPLEAAQAHAMEPAGGVNEQVPALEPAIPAPHDPTPPQARRHADTAAQAHGPHAEPVRAGAGRLDQPLEWTAAATSAAGFSAQPSAAQPPATPLPLAQARLQELTLQDVPPALMPEPPFVSEASLADDIAPALSTEPIAPAPGFEEAVAAAEAPAHDGGPAQEALDAYASTAAAATPPHAGAPAAGRHAGDADAPTHGPAPATAHGGIAGRMAAPHAGHGLSADDVSGSRPGVAVGAGAGAAVGAAAGNGTGSAAYAKPEPLSSGAGSARGTAARARAAAHAAAQQDQPRRDPARVRLAMLGGALALVAGTLAGVYWYALTSPGPGASLPPVPMPPPGAATGPAPVAVVVPAAGQPDGPALPAPGLPESAAPESLQRPPGDTGLPPALATAGAGPHNGSRMPSDDDLQHALQQQASGTPHGQAHGDTPVNARQPAPSAPANPPITPNPSNNTYSTSPAAQPGAATLPADIQVTRGTAPQRINAALQDGYQAFMAGNYTSAAQHYASALRQDPNNRDALLGNSAIAARRNDIAAATSGYQRLLELNPNDADAQAGLLALRPGDPGHSEMRLKELLRRDPGAGPLEFALGNLYAQQGRWPDAQQAYFRAYTSVPDNADYAFNLAVGLDRLSQRKLALTYYQRALDLSRTGPAAFDRTAARRRADQLTAPSATQPGAQTTPNPGGTPAPVTPAIAAASLPPGPGVAFTPPSPPGSGSANDHAGSPGAGNGNGNGNSNGRQP